MAFDLLSEQLWPGSNFLKRAKWSPDGHSLLTSSEERELRIFSIDNDEDRDARLNGVSWEAREAETIHEIDWYPWMRKDSPPTCCFISCSHDLPIHLWDANVQSIRCSYIPFDQLDQFASAYCCVFSPDGGRIFAGCKKSIQVFDSFVPGRALEKLEGLKGPISAVSCRKDNNYILAAGSFNGSIGIFDPRANNEDSMAMQLNDHQEGITQVEFSVDGWNLFSVARKESFIAQWDLRTGSIVNRYGPRESATNQRILFCLSNSNLYSGDQHGNLLRFEINCSEQVDMIQSAAKQPIPNSMAINCVDVRDSLMATTSGERMFPLDSDETMSPSMPSLRLWKIKSK